MDRLTDLVRSALFVLFLIALYVLASGIDEGLKAPQCDLVKITKSMQEKDQRHYICDGKLQIR